MTDIPTRIRPENASTVAEFAERKRICRATVYNEARAGRLNLSKVAGRTVILESDELAYDALIRAEADARRKAGKQPQPENQSAA